MTQTQDGGPAFPSEQGHNPDGTWNQTYCQGMSLRDWFAGQALAGLLSGYFANPESSGMGQADMANCAYEQADAMIAARGKP